MSKRILFIDDQLEDWEGLLGRGLAPFGFELYGEENPYKAIKVIRVLSPDIVLLDILFGDKLLGKPTLVKIKQKFPDLPVIMITSTMDKTEYNPEDYILSDYRYAKVRLTSGDFSDLAARLNQVIENIRAKTLERKKDETGLARYGFIVGKTKAMKDLAATIEKIAEQDQTVLVTGESGTGKELVARAVHKLSGRDGPFVAINCGAIPENLIESELFGHERGAFTTAIAQKIGKFEIAGQGTIFLDEISEMPFDTQVKLLRFLQEKKYERVGGNMELSSNARIIAATNSNLEDMVKKGTFREDLYYRLNVIPIHVPPFRERKEDIPDFFKYFVSKASGEPQKVLTILRDDVKELLNSYSWPGNVREFEHQISRAVALAEESILQVTNFADLAKGGNSDQYVPADVDEIVDRIFKDELTWEQIRTEFGTKGNMRREIVLGVAERWWNEHRHRPRSKDLAELLSVSDGNMRQILKECVIKLTQIEKQ